MTTDNDADNDVFFMSGQRAEYADRPCSLSVLPVTIAKGVRFARFTQNENLVLRVFQTLSNFGSPPANPWGD